MLLVYGVYCLMKTSKTPPQMSAGASLHWASEGKFLRRILEIGGEGRECL